MDMSALAPRLAAWIKEKTLAASCRGVVLGLSGGIDSAVLAVLCRQAFPESTLAVVMPCHSQPEDREHALAVAGKFGIPTREVVLDGVYDGLLAAFPDDDAADARCANLAGANLKARLRMLTLYYLANRHQYAVAGSSNRSEIATGYFTKYGDGGVDFMPLGNLVKQQVRELARHLGVPEAVIAKPPSAGLWAGQTDEADLGFTYEALDRYLLTGEAPPELKARVEAMMSNSRHKRALPPIAEL